MPRGRRDSAEDADLERVVVDLAARCLDRTLDVGPELDHEKHDPDRDGPDQADEEGEEESGESEEESSDEDARLVQGSS